MNKKTIIAAAVAAALTAFSSNAASFKRGICVNSFNEAQMELLAPGVTWYYNWAASHSLPALDGIDFAPMAWSGINAETLRNYCKAHPEVKYLLGFNEPNFTNQADLTPAQAAEKWPELQALAKELGLKLVAPALNYSTGTYANPSKWMDEFVALVGEDAFDYTAIHCYGGLGVIKTLSTEFYEKYKKPVWLTEFCFWPGGAGNVYVSPEAQISSMIESVQYLEQSEHIYRYAWFMATGPYDSPERANYALVRTEGTLSDYHYELTPQGYVYTYMSTFDKNVWTPENTWQPAALVTDAANVGYGHGQSDYTDYPLIVSSVTASSGWVEYQFDVKSAGTKILDLIVGGYGEPKRFDPTLTITATHADGTVVTVTDKEQFTLPDNDRCTQRMTWEFEAPKPGHYTVQIADAGRSSGLTLGAVMLADKAGIDAVEAEGDPAGNAPVDVYTLAGVKVRSAVDRSEATVGLPAGFYLVGNEKVFVK